MTAKILDVLNKLGDDPIIFVEIEEDNRWNGLMIAGGRHYALTAESSRQLALILNRLADALDMKNKEGKYGN